MSAKKPAKKSAEKSAEKKTYFGPISDRRGPSPELVSPFDVIIAGLDTKESERIAAQGDEEAQAVADATVESSNRELHELLTDPAKFFTSHKNEERRGYNLHSVESVFTTGGLLVTPAARAVGDGFLVEIGRHRTVWMRIAHLILDGKVHVPQLAAVVAAARQKNGPDWRPPFFVSKPPPGTVATVNIDIENSLRLVPTQEERFEQAMKRVVAAERAEMEPDYASIARNLNLESASMVKNWRTLSTMHAKVKKYVLVGTGPDLQGPRFPLGSALEIQRKAKDKAEQLALVEAMIAAGDTRVATAKNTARGGGSSGGGEGSSGGGEGSSSPVVCRAGWTKAEFLKFYDGAKEMPPVIQAVAKLLRDGPDKLTPAQRRYIPGLDEFLAPTKPGDE